MELKKSKSLSGLECIALDTAPFIYYIEENKAYIDVLHQLFTQVSEGRITAYTSVVTLIEVLTKPIEEGDKALSEKYAALLNNSENLYLIDVDRNMAPEIARLRAKYHIKTPDAIQIVTGMANGAEAFITNDLTLKRVKDIKVILLSELGR